jgi:hypothetical protein
MPAAERRIACAREDLLEGSVVDRYVRGRMPVAERVAFEEHFLDCQDCLEQLEIARSFMEGVKIAATQAVAVPAVFVLNEVRGSETAEDAPANRITIPKSPSWIVLAIERDFSQYPNYRVAVRNRDGKAVWQQDHLAPSSPDAIRIGFPSTVLSPSDYTLDLAAVGPAGQLILTANYSFRAVK